MLQQQLNLSQEHYQPKQSTESPQPPSRPIIKPKVKTETIQQTSPQPSSPQPPRQYKPMFSKNILEKMNK